ncbi:MAG: hypothetical protein WD825_04420 [Gemmatimonadaceae bacterium]
MTLQRLLFEPTLIRSPLRVVRWWESRRLTYNAIVGITGLGTLIYVNVLELVMGGGWLMVPWQAIVAYGVGANICYTFGWVVENFVERWLERPVYGLGPALFRHGLVFSIGLTLVPAVVVTIANIAGRLLAR